MASQAQPKKISLIGNNGLEYWLLSKRESRGDMENCGVINRLFNQNIESRNRLLNLHNYSVICIEWVNNTNTLRNLLGDTYIFNQSITNCSQNDLTLKEVTAHLRAELANIQSKFTEQRSINSAELSYEFEKQIVQNSPKIFRTYFIRMV